MSVNSLLSHGALQRVAADGSVNWKLSQAKTPLLRGRNIECIDMLGVSETCRVLVQRLQLSPLSIRGQVGQQCPAVGDKVSVSVPV